MKVCLKLPRLILLPQIVTNNCVFHLLLDLKHSMPVCQMGNYQEYLKRMQPQLREIESVPVRQHMFGNPFKIDKVMVISRVLLIFGVCYFLVFTSIRLEFSEYDG